MEDLPLCFIFDHVLCIQVLHWKLWIVFVSIRLILSLQMLNHLHRRSAMLCHL